MKANYIDLKVLERMYEIAEDVLADSMTEVGSYYAKDLALWKDTKHVNNWGDTLPMQSFNKRCTLLGCDVDYPITISMSDGGVDSYACTFNRCDVFYYITIFEKLCGLTGDKRRKFVVKPYIEDEDTIAA